MAYLLGVFIIPAAQVRNLGVIEPVSFGARQSRDLTTLTFDLGDHGACRRHGSSY